LKSLISRLTAILPELDVSGWILLAAPFALSLAFVVSVGPEVQRHAFSAVGGDAATLYQAAYKQGIPQFPSLLTWLGRGFDWPYLLMATITVLVSLRAHDLKGVIIYAGVSTTILYTFIDTWLLIGARVFNLPALVTNITGNVTGGFLVGVVVASGLLIFRATSRLMFLGKIRRISAALALVAFGIAVSAITYLAILFIYRPLPVDIILVSSQPMTGAFSGDPAFATVGNEPADLDPKQERSPFQFLPTDPSGGVVEIMTVGGKPLTQWRRSSSSQSYTAEVRFFLDCPFLDVKEFPKTAPTLVEPNVRTIDIALAARGSRVFAQPSRDAAFKFIPFNLTQYWVEADKKPDTARVAHFSRAQDTFTVTSQGPTSFLVSATLFATPKRTGQIEPYELSVDLNGIRRRLLFAPVDRISADGRPHCRPINSDQRSAIAQAGAPSRTPIHFPADIVDFTALISLRPTASMGEPIYEEGNRLTVSGAEGWNSVTAIPQSRLQKSRNGVLNFITVESGVSELAIDGSNVEVKPYDNITAFGDLSGDYLANGQLLVSGRSHAVFQNSRLLNSTKWEHLPNEWRIWLLTGIGAGLLWGLRYLLGQLRERKDENAGDWVH
jgi:hypothetical protein